MVYHYVVELLIQQINALGGWMVWVRLEVLDQQLDARVCVGASGIAHGVRQLSSVQFRQRL